MKLLLLAFLHMTSTEQIQYIKSQNLDLYQDEVPGQFRKYFDEGTLGLYLSPRNDSFGVERGTLIMRKDAGIWTLTHEFAHALIDQKRTDTSESTTFEDLTNAKEDYEEGMATYRNLGFFPSEKRIYDSMRTWTGIQMDLLYHFELEEVKIEKTLQEIYEEEPELLPDTSYQSSHWYVNKSCEKALLIARHVNEVNEYVTSKLNTIETNEHTEYLKNQEQQIISLCR